MDCQVGDLCALRRRSQKPSHKEQQIHLSEQTHAKNSVSDKNDIIDWAKYVNCGLSALHESRIPSQPKVAQSETGHSIISFINKAASQPRGILRKKHPSAIQKNEHIQGYKSNNISIRLIYERKESPLTVLVTSLLLLVLVLSGWPPNSQNAVSCLGSVPGHSISRNDHNIPHNYPALRSTSRQLNFNLPFWVSPTNNPGPNNHYMANFNAGESSPTISTIESFYSDQSSQAAQSAVAPLANSWTPSLIPSTQDSLDEHVKNILVPRVSGTPGNVKVRQYIVDSLDANDYTVQLDEFTDNTPVGKVKFANIIAYSNPNACRQLVLACHYDSKMMDGFLGAVDSAVPCAMLLKISETFKAAFRAKDGESARNSLGLQFLFFDGEEAFVEWTSTDSLYGSRHLAAKWDKQKPPQQCSGTSELSRIELLVLLDLIGSKDTSFVVYTNYDPAINRRVQAHHNNFRKYERAYLTSGVGGNLSSAQANREAAFKTRQMPIYLVEDDHVPFLKRGVPVLSLLAHPFPKVWHTTADNYEAIDFPKTRRLVYVLEQWLANYEQKSS